MKNLKKIRLAANLTLEKFSKDIGISNQMLSNYELEKSSPSINTMIKIADYFGVSLDYLCGRPNKNLLFIDSLSTEKQQLIELIKGLDDEETLIAIGWISKLANKPIDDVLRKIH